MDAHSKGLMWFLPLFFSLILIGCDGSDGSSSATPTSTPGAYTENDFVADPTLRIPITKTAVTFLEPPNAVEEVDTYEPGADTVPYYIQEPGEYTFCWDGEIEGSQHYMYLQDVDGKEVLQVSVDEDCVMAHMESGNYTMFIVHDDLTTGVQPIFMVVDSGEDDESLQVQYDPNHLKVLLTYRKCCLCDLTDANLTDANLTKVNLTGADLTRANLTEANLTDANLTDANLTGADLRGANLTRVILFKADLREADLRGADLSRAELEFANLTRADLRGADLTMAFLRSAKLNDADLTRTDLTRANLRKADLTRAILEGAILNGADLSFATWWDRNVCQEGSIGECIY